MFGDFWLRFLWSFNTMETCPLSAKHIMWPPLHGFSANTSHIFSFSFILREGKELSTIDNSFKPLQWNIVVSLSLWMLTWLCATLVPKVIMQVIQGKSNLSNTSYKCTWHIFSADLLLQYSVCNCLSKWGSETVGEPKHRDQWYKLHAIGYHYI